MAGIALAVCLLLDDRADTAVRRLWTRLEAAGVPTLRSHTHGRHVPHLSYAALRSYELAAVSSALEALDPSPALTLRFDGLGTFRRSRCWLAPAVNAELVQRQQAVVEAVTRTGADLHHHYAPGRWLPHVTLAPRLHLTDLAAVAGAVYDILPLRATSAGLALVDTSTGRGHPWPHLS